MKKKKVQDPMEPIRTYHGCECHGDRNLDLMSRSYNDPDEHFNIHVQRPLSALAWMEQNREEFPNGSSVSEVMEAYASYRLKYINEQ